MPVTGNTLSIQYDNAKTVKFILFDRQNKFLVAGTGVVETYNNANLSTYKIDATPLTGLDFHQATIPSISVLPEKFTVLALDDADDSIIGASEIILDSSGNEVNEIITETAYDLQNIDGIELFNALEIIAGTVAGENSGVGTSTETYKGLDKTTNRLETAFDSSGNRQTATYNP